MLLKDFIPPPDVREFVQLYRIVHLQFEKGQPVPHKAYPPRPEHCLAFYPFDTETVKYVSNDSVVKDIPVVLYGQFSEVTNRIIGHRFLVFQVIFYPGALYRLMGISANELTNQYLDAEIFFSTALREVNEKLYHAPSYHNMTEVVTAYIRGMIKRQKHSRLPVDDACILLLTNNRKFTLQQLAKEACLSSRQLERKFKELSGVNPKLYDRIVRFDRAFRLKNSRPQMDWLRIAMDCNYHDYQHLVREYKDFTGLGPNAFHEIENKAPERAFGLSEGYYG